MTQTWFLKNTLHTTRSHSHRLKTCLALLSHVAHHTAAQQIVITQTHTEAQDTGKTFCLMIQFHTLKFTQSQASQQFQTMASTLESRAQLAPTHSLVKDTSPMSWLHCAKLEATALMCQAKNL